MSPRAPRSLIGLLCLVLSTLGAIGCSSQPQTTRLTAGDYRYTVDETVNKLVQAGFFRERTAASPRATVMVDRVTNLTSDLIPEPEQWMFVLEVWNSEAVKQITRAKNVTTQVSPERLEMIRTQFPGAGSSYAPPTHLLRATFNTATRMGNTKGGYGNSRTEQYQMEYSLVETNTGTLVWSDIVEFKRHADGNVID